MALDEALLESANRDNRLCFRFYRWTEPTLSLGYFQAAAERSSHATSADCCLVRRLTGGGAILHDHELTYSLTVPARHPMARDRDRLYRLAHGALIAALDSAFALRAVLCPAVPAARPEPFLCFQRRSPGDVLLGEWKIAGSAQRRRRGAVLQHGSLLLRRSTCAPELPGIEDLSGMSLPIERLCSAWLDALASAGALDFESAAVDAAERQLAERLHASRYATPTWNDFRQ